jgi:hypothetical protein
MGLTELADMSNATIDDYRYRQVKPCFVFHKRYGGTGYLQDIFIGQSDEVLVYNLGVLIACTCIETKMNALVWT